ncbi:hypothetical protein [Klebsiella pneumoniae IS46]|nr:hypothetical protein [Klebsiella pneumoniae IS46]
MPVLTGHDIRSILFASRFPSGFFFIRKTRKNSEFQSGKGQCCRFVI